jgi:aminoglycoside phosphotransferase (APT) family kinase protein
MSRVDAMTGPRHTHRIQRHGSLIRKTYRSWSRGEPHREWGALQLLADHQPGLAPGPVRADLEGDPPSITMATMPGEPLTGRWSDRQLDALAEAVDRLWSVRPDRMPPLGWREPSYWRELAQRSTPPTDEIGRDAYARAIAWIGSAGPQLLKYDTGVVLGQGDPQYGNLLYDAETGTVTLIDFEDAGPSDICLELANFGEHLGNRRSGLDRLADRIAVDHERLLEGRRLWASFWLLRLTDPARAAERTEQSRRLLELFD